MSDKSFYEDEGFKKLLVQHLNQNRIGLNNILKYLHDQNITHKRDALVNVATQLILPIISGFQNNTDNIIRALKFTIFGVINIMQQDGELTASQAKRILLQFDMSDFIDIDPQFKMVKSKDYR